MKLTYLVSPEDGDITVKAVLKTRLEVSGSLIKRLKLDGRILCNGSPVRVTALTKPGDCVEALVDFQEECDNILPEKMDLDILFEDDCLVVMNKPAFTVVHPTSTHLTGTIANGLMDHFIRQGLCRKIRPVSRLDRDTTGIILFAKNEYVQESLIRQMKDKRFTKEYLGVVYGRLANSCGTINLPIDRKPDSIMLRHISPLGSAAVTHYSVEEYFTWSTLVRFDLETGRTHQIRVHCQAIGHPLVGDTLYPHLASQCPPMQSENLSSAIGRQALHSSKVRFFHPQSGKELELSAPLPADFLKLLEITRK